MIKTHNCESIFELLDIEKKKMIQEETYSIDTGVDPTLVWSIVDLKGNFFKESDPFWYDGVQWKLAVDRFESDYDLKVSMKMMTNPFETKESKDYFKKKEYFLPSNMIQNQINVI